MKNVCIPVLAALVSVMSANGADEGIHLFILSGQSNMGGLDPKVSFTPAVEQAFGKENVLVVRDAMGGQPIRRWYKEWKPGAGERPEPKGKAAKPDAKGKNKGPEVNGDLYDRLMTKVRAAITNQKVRTVTFVWMQGESDAKQGHGAVYADSLKGLIQQLCRDLERKDINVVIGRINDACLNAQVFPHGEMVRQVQVEVAESLPRCAWVDTDDLNDAKTGVHATKEGYKTLGERFAKKAIELISKEKPGKDRAP